MRQFSVRSWRFLAIAGALAVLGATVTFAQSTDGSNTNQSPWSNPAGPTANAENGVTPFGPMFSGQGPMLNRQGPMMRGGQWTDNDNFGRGNGPRGGYGMGYGNGPGAGVRGAGGPGFGPGAGGVGRGYGFSDFGTGASIGQDQVPTIVNGFLARFTGGSYQISRILQFANNYYVQVTDSSKKAPAFELVVNANGGAVHPTPVTMQWNTSYGRAQYSLQGNVGQMSVTSSQAAQNAKDYVTKVSSNASVSSPVQYSGYYSFIVSDNGKTVGVLSVNGYNGQVWYQNWNGAFVKSVQ